MMISMTSLIRGWRRRLPHDLTAPEYRDRASESCRVGVRALWAPGSVVLALIATLPVKPMMRPLSFMTHVALLELRYNVLQLYVHVSVMC